MHKIFENTEVAFSLKTDTELERAHFLFRMIQNEPLVRIGTAVTNFALKTRMPVEGLIRSTVFDHFCGGINENDCVPTIDKMHSKNVCSVLDYSVEGKSNEAQFDAAVEKILHIIQFSKDKKAVPFAVFKPTAFGAIDIYEKVSLNKSLSEEENVAWNKIVNRFDKVCKTAFEKDVPLLIDAEESWMQDAADDLVEEMMEKYNKDKAIVFNTLQMYRHDRMDYMKKLYDRAKEKGYFIGMKVVRGAYMEKERERAAEKGYESPICKDKRATDENYDTAIKFFMDKERLALFAGTHNEESSYKLMQLAEEKSVLKSDKRLWFGQLYGMSDHISFNLANEGYNVAKYLPFGPVRDVMPYLIRRAEENTSVAGQTSRELKLLKAEKERRKL